MRAIKIDPFTKEIKEIDIGDNFEDLLAAIGSDGVEATQITRNDVIWLDDEGLLKDYAKYNDDTVPMKYFEVGETVISGIGIVMANNAAGETVPTRLDVDSIKGVVKWIDSKEEAHAIVNTRMEDEIKRLEQQGMNVQRISTGIFMVTD